MGNMLRSPGFKSYIGYRNPLLIDDKGTFACLHAVGEYRSFTLTKTVLDNSSFWVVNIISAPLPPSIFTCATVPNLGHTSEIPDRPCHTHRLTHAPTPHSQMSPFIIITNSLCIPDYHQPILLGVTDRFETWKAGIGHSQYCRKLVRDQHGRVSGIRQKLWVCACVWQLLLLVTC